MTLNTIVGFAAFLCVVVAMRGIAFKRSWAQLVMVLAQLLWLSSAILTKNVFLGVQSLVLLGCVIRIWFIWRREEREGS